MTSSRWSEPLTQTETKGETQMELSACIVVYNGAQEAIKAAQTVLDCTRRYPLTLYLVDNASPDDTVLSLLHSRVHFILNPDIQLTADTLSDLADWMAAHPGVVMTRPGLTFPDGRPQQLPLRRCNVRAMVYRQLPCLRFWAKYNDRYLMADKDLTKPIEIEFCTGSFSAVDTAAFKAVGGFDEGYFMYVEDADLTQKMRTQGKAYLVPQYTAIHAWHRAAHRSLKPFLWQLRSLLRYFSKWGFAW